MYDSKSVTLRSGRSGKGFYCYANELWQALRDLEKQESYSLYGETWSKKELQEALKLLKTITYASWIPLRQWYEMGRNCNYNQDLKWQCVDRWEIRRWPVIATPNGPVSLWQVKDDIKAALNSGRIYNVRVGKAVVPIRILKDWARVLEKETVQISPCNGGLRLSAHRNTAHLWTHYKGNAWRPGDAQDMKDSVTNTGRLVPVTLTMST